MDVRPFRNREVAGSRPVSGSTRDRLLRLKVRADRIRGPVAQAAAHRFGKAEVAVSSTARPSMTAKGRAVWGPAVPCSDGDSVRFRGAAPLTA